MRWWERFQVGLTAFGSGFDSLFNLLGSPTDENDSYLGTVLGRLGGFAKGMTLGVGNTLAAPIQGLGEASDWGIDKITYPIRTAKTAMNLAQSPTWLKQQGYSIPVGGNPLTDWTQGIPGLEQVGALFGTTGPGAIGNAFGVNWEALLDEDTWNKAWNDAKSHSLGQSVWEGYAWDGKPIDIADPQALSKLRDDPLFNVTSGLTDGVVAWYADPTGRALEAVGAARRVSKGFGVGASDADNWLEQMLYKPLGDKRTADELSDSDEVTEFLEWASGKSARDILEHPAIKNSTRKDDFAGVMAGLLDRQDFDTARKVIAVGYGSEKAWVDLQNLNQGLALRLESVREGSNKRLDAELLQREANKEFSKLTGKNLQKAVEDLNPYSPTFTGYDDLRQILLDSDEEMARIYSATLGEFAGSSGLQYGLINQRIKSGQINKAERNISYATGDLKEYLNSSGLPRMLTTDIMPKAFGIPIRVITHFPFKVAQSFTNKRPPSWIDPNRDDASGGLMAYMRTSKVFDEVDEANYLNKYVTALSIDGRKSVVEEVEKEAIDRIGRKHGFSEERIDQLSATSIGKRNGVINSLKQPKEKGYWLDTDGSLISWPVFETQQVNAFPLLDLQEFESVLKRNKDGLLGAAYSAEAFANRIFDTFNGLWSAATLLRGGYALRNIVDAELRMAATAGAMSIVAMAASGSKLFVQNGLKTRVGNLMKRGKFVADISGQTASILAKSAVARPKGKLLDPSESVWNQLQAATRNRIDELGRDLGSVVTQDSLGITYKGVEHMTPFSGKAGAYKVLAGASFDNIAQTRDSLLKGFRSELGLDNPVYNPGERGHLENWAHIINNVIGKDETARKYFNGDDVASVRQWLTRSPEGRNVLRKIRMNPNNAKLIAGKTGELVDRYVPLVAGDNPNLLRQLAKDGKVTPKILEDIFPAVEARPQVWDAFVGFNLAGTGREGMLDRVIDRAFRWISKSEDKVVRNPAFRQLYTGNVRRLHDLKARETPEAEWTSDEVERIGHAAHQMTLKQFQKTFYEGSVKSNVAHRFRMLAGFFSAWEDSVRKWGRLIIDRPELLIQGGKLWNAPNDMGLGSTVDSMTGQRVPRLQTTMPEKDAQGRPTGKWIEAPPNYNPWEINEDARIEIRLPEALAKRIPGSYGSQWNISKESLNLVLQGDPWWLPSVGPVGQFAVSELALAYPTALTDVYKWAIPYGPETNPVLAASPAWLQRIIETNDSVTDGAFADNFLRIAQTEYMRSVKGERPAIDDWNQFYKEIEDRATKFHYLRSFINFFMPFSAQQASPYQYYIDEYRAIRQSQPKDDRGNDVTDEQFLEKFGDDFYIFATSLSKNNTGLPASKRAWELSEKNRELIAKDPEMARVYLSDLDDETFDQYVYAAQFKQKFGGTYGFTGRERQNPLDSIKDNQRKLGWTKYVSQMDYIDGLEETGEYDPNLLSEVRTAVGLSIGSGNDEWWKDFTEVDLENVPARIDKMKELVSEKAIAGRPEIRQLATYLGMREQFLEILDERKAAGLPYTVEAEANQDLMAAWKAVQLNLARENTLFGRNIFWRFLSNDKLQRSRLDAVKEEAA